MTKFLFAALLLAAPASAWAQSNTSPGSTSAARPGVTGNLDNPQAQANQAGQPANARTLTGSDAKSIPMPTTGGSAQIPQPSEPSKPNAIK